MYNFNSNRDALLLYPRVVSDINYNNDCFGVEMTTATE